METAKIATLATSGLQKTSALLQIIREIKQAPRAVRDVKKDIEALTHVLDALRNASKTNGDREYSDLEIPLKRCGNACQEFAAILGKLSGGSSGAKPGVKDWMKLKELNIDTNSFKYAIAGYKDTVSVVLAGVTFRTTTINHETFEKYQHLIEDTTNDLIARLDETNGHLQRVLRNRGADGSDISKLKNEKEGIEKCLEVCSKAAANVAAPKRNGPSGNSGTTATRGGSLAMDWMLAGDDPSIYHRHLEARMQSLSSRIEQMFIDQSYRSPANRELERELREELDSLQHQISVGRDAAEEADRANTNTFEDISAADDGFQAIASTTGELITAKRIRAGPRTPQTFGQMSDATIQQIAMNRGGLSTTLTPDQTDSMASDIRDQYIARRALPSAEPWGRQSPWEPLRQTNTTPVHEVSSQIRSRS